MSQNQKRLSPRVAHNFAWKLHMEKNTAQSHQILAGQKKKAFLQYTAMTADNQGEAFTATDSTSEDMNHCCT